MSSQSFNVTAMTGKDARVFALAVDGVEDLFLRPAAIVVCPEHIRVPAAGDDAGTFLDARVAHASEQPDARAISWPGSAALPAVSDAASNEASSRVFIWVRAMLVPVAFS
jgi:hypothetical protein